MSSYLLDPLKASTLGNGGFEGDNRYQGAYSARARVQEADPGRPPSSPGAEAYGGWAPSGLQGRSPAESCSGQGAALTKWVTLPDWKVIPLPAGQPGERVCSPSELRQLLGQQIHQFYARDSGYKERIATSPAAAEDCCSKWAVIGQCADGHTVAKEILCGREWCIVCGEEWSNAHQRRFARWVSDKKDRKTGKLLRVGMARQMAKMGYWVIEWPDDSRSRLRTKRVLKSADCEKRKCTECPYCTCCLVGIGKWGRMDSMDTKVR